MANELSECRVLVVEDEPIVALDLAEVLERHGATVVRRRAMLRMRGGSSPALR